MKINNKFLAILIVCLSICIFGIAGFLHAAESAMKTQEGKKSMLEGAKQIMDGNKMIMDMMAKKGIKDADLTAAEKKMAEGYKMVTKGDGMMTGSTMAQGKQMMEAGAKMMLEAQLATSDAVEKHGMTAQCSSIFETCAIGEKKIDFGREYFGFPPVKR